MFGVSSLSLRCRFSFSSSTTSSFFFSLPLVSLVFHSPSVPVPVLFFLFGSRTELLDTGLFRLGCCLFVLGYHLFPAITRNSSFHFCHTHQTSSESVWSKTLISVSTRPGPPHHTPSTPKSICRRDVSFDYTRVCPVGSYRRGRPSGKRCPSGGSSEISSRETEWHRAQQQQQGPR